MDFDDVGERIRRARKLAGLTQAELAALAGLSTMSIRRYENGDRVVSLSKLKSIAQALKVDYNWLCAGSEIQKTENTVSSAPLSEADKYRAGLLKFNSEMEMISHFYQLLNDKGKLSASICFLSHLDKNEDVRKTVADLVLSLSENPFFRGQDAPEVPLSIVPSPTEGGPESAAPSPEEPKESEDEAE